MTKAIYAFSGDPITYGHIDIIRRAAKVFSYVVVGIGENPDKKYTFSLAERKEMARLALLGIENVEVVAFDGLLIDYAFEQGIDVVVKGVRNTEDFNYENILHQVGQSQVRGIDTHILFADPKLGHVSSSAVKAIYKHHGDIHEYVTLNVKQALEWRLSKQVLLGVTGVIGSGKSEICRMASQIDWIHHIDLDQIGHEVLESTELPLYYILRKKIVKLFGNKVVEGDIGDSETCKIDRHRLGEIVFQDKDKLRWLNNLLHQPILVRLRKKLDGLEGVILLESAILAEMELGYLCNNHFVLVKTTKEQQRTNLYGRSLSQEQLRRRIDSQFSQVEKSRAMTKAILRDHAGQIDVIENAPFKTEDEIRRYFEGYKQFMRIRCS